MTKIRIVAVGTLLLVSSAIGGASVLQLHVTWQGETSTTLLVRPEEVTLFLGRKTTGWSGNYLEWAVQLFGNIFGHSTVPTHAFETLSVYTVTPGRVDESHFRDRDPPTTVRILDGDVLFTSRAGVERWTGTTFVRASPEQRQAFWQAASRPLDEEGAAWSYKTNLLSGSEGTTDVILGRTRVTVSTSTRFTDSTQHEIAILFDGTVQKRIAIDTRPRYVGAAEYLVLFAVSPAP